MKTYRNGQSINTGDVITTPDGPAYVAGYNARQNTICLVPCRFVPADSLTLRDGGLVVLDEKEIAALDQKKAETEKAAASSISAGTTLE